MFQSRLNALSAKASLIWSNNGFLKLSKFSQISKRFNETVTTSANNNQNEEDARITDPVHGYELNHTRNSGVIMPALGFGTWGCNHFENDVIAKAVDDAIKIGYRHFDCARVYDNEQEIGYVIQDNIKNDVIKREQLFITSKLYNQDHLRGYHCLHDTLKKLQTDYLDCFLIHWPFQNHAQQVPKPYNEEEYQYCWKILVELMAHGLVRSVGVSNCTITKLTSLIEYCKAFKITIPSVNQVELHPYLQQPHLLKFCWDNGIIVSAAMPLGSPERPARFRRDDDPILLENDVVKEIANEINASPAQVLIRWHLDRNHILTPKATETWMIQQNIEALNIKLTKEQLNKISNLDKNFRYGRAEFLAWKDNQDWREFWDFEDDLWVKQEY